LIPVLILIDLLNEKLAAVKDPQVAVVFGKFSREGLLGPGNTQQRTPGALALWP
jgi:hypothetical protein